MTKKIIFFLFLLCSTFQSNGFAVQKMDQESGKPYVAGEIIVKFKNSLAVEYKKLQITGKTSIQSVDNLNIRFKAKEIEPLVFNKREHAIDRIVKLKFEGDQTIETILDKYRDDPNIEWAEPNYLYRATIEPNDPYFTSQWYLSKIQAPEAWDIETGSANVIIGIIDSGVDLDHPDLKDNIWVNTGEIPDNNLDDDNNGFTDDVHGWDYVTHSNDPNPKPNGIDDDDQDGVDDGVNHGTHVAGIAAAAGNNLAGIAGVSWNCRIMAVKVLNDEGSGSFFNIGRGIVYAVDNGADVINLSLGGSYSIEFNDEIAYANSHNVVVVCAAGNENMNIDNNRVSPACNDNNSNQVVGVAATDHNDKKTVFSNYGNQYVDISAPGLSILSAFYYDPAYNFDSYYGFYSGTSMAAPVVAGVAALIKSNKPELTNTEIQQIISDHSDNIDNLNPNYTGKLGRGRVNAFKAIQSLDTSKTAAIKISPTLNEIRIHSSVLVNIEIEDVSSLGAFEFELVFDPNIIQIDSSEHVSLGEFLGSSGRNVSSVGPVIDNTNGLLTFGGFSFGNNPGVSGNGILAKITFTAKDTGTTVLEFQEMQITDTDGRTIPFNSENNIIHVTQFFWADINHDNKIDITDIQIVAGKWNTKKGDPLYDPICDVDNEGQGDGDIDIVDIQLVAWWWQKNISNQSSLAYTSKPFHTADTALVTIDYPRTTNPDQSILQLLIQNAREVGAFQFDVKYNRKSSAIEAVHLGDFFKDNLDHTTILSKSDLENGLYRYGAFSFGNNRGIQGSGLLAEIIFNKNNNLSLSSNVENILLTDIRGRTIPVKIEQQTKPNIDDLSTSPETYYLAQNYPNPFPQSACLRRQGSAFADNPTTTINYYLPKESRVKLTIFNLLGEEVATIVDKTQTAGYHSVLWNVRDLASGLYFYCLQADKFSQVKKMLVTK